MFGDSEIRFQAYEKTNRKTDQNVCQRGKNNKIDIITHPGFRLDIDYRELGKVCADYGTYVELSSRHRTPDCKGLEQLLTTDCKFVLNSDAHKPENVGECAYALELAQKYSIPADRIANADGKTLVLRSKQ